MVMRDMEHVLGWWRVALVYLLSGIAGSLTSSIFVPYHVEVGVWWMFDGGLMGVWWVFGGCLVDVWWVFG